MKRFKKGLSVLIALAVIFGIGSFIPQSPFRIPHSYAAYSGITPPSPGSPGYETMTFTLTGTVSASTTGIIAFKMPWPCTLIQVQASAQAITGGAATLNLKEAGTTVLSSVITLTTAGQVYEGTISDTAIAKDAAMTIDLTVTTSIANGTIVLVLKRK
jgi:hypothetical protein